MIIIVISEIVIIIIIILIIMISNIRIIRTELVVIFIILIIIASRVTKAEAQLEVSGWRLLPARPEIQACNSRIRPKPYLINPTMDIDMYTVATDIGMHTDIALDSESPNPNPINT